MQQANTQVAKSLEHVDNTETKLHLIDEDSRKAASNVQNIVDAIREQDAAIQQLASNIDNISPIAAETRLQKKIVQQPFLAVTWRCNSAICPVRLTNYVSLQSVMAEPTAL